MIRSRRGLILAASVACFVTLLATFPARVALHWASPPGVSVAGIQGSVWSGSAREVLANGVYLTDVTWRSQPLKLLLGRLAYDLDTETPGGFVRGTAAVSIGGSLTAQDLQASLPASMLETALGMQGLGGTVNLDFDELQVVDGNLVAADGVLRVANLTLPIVSRQSLGGFEAEFMTQPEHIQAAVEDTDAVVDLAASLSLSTDRSWELTGFVAPKPNTPEGLRSDMRLLGPANERGQQEIRLEGRF